MLYLVSGAIPKTKEHCQRSALLFGNEAHLRCIKNEAAFGYEALLRNMKMKNVRFASYEPSECFMAQRAVSYSRSECFIGKTVVLCYNKLRKAVE